LSGLLDGLWPPHPEWVKRAIAPAIGKTRGTATKRPLWNS